MRRLAVACFILCSIAVAQAQFIGAGIWKGGVAACGGYSGPGDVVTSGWVIWGGLRAFSAAKCGAAAAIICNPADATCSTVSSSATTGAVTIPTIGGESCSVAISSGTYTTATGATVLTTSVGSNLVSTNVFVLTGLTGTGGFASLNNIQWTATTGTTGTTINFTGTSGLGATTITGGTVNVCTVKQLYDQTVGSLCTGTCDAIQNTVVQRPFVMANCFGSLPCLLFAAGGTTPPTIGTAQTATNYGQPTSWSLVFNQAAAGASYTGSIIGTPTISQQVAWNVNTNVIQIYANGAGGFNSAAAGAAPHAVNVVFNGATSVINIDGTQTSPGTNPGLNSATGMLLGNDSFGNYWAQNVAGKLAEAGLNSNGFSTTQQNNECQNQRVYWGLGATCP